MNFGKLLAVGKSMVNGSAEVSYRTNKQVYLPKFESPKNPFTSLPKPPPEKADAPVRNGIAAAQMSRGAMPRPMPDAVVPPAPVATTATVPPVAFPGGRWTSKLNPMSIVRPTPVARPATPAVQAELSLDTVKVVHNDLTDADVEVVPMKSRPAPPDLPPARKSWEILGERLLKATAL